MDRHISPLNLDGGQSIDIVYSNQSSQLTCDSLMISRMSQKRKIGVKMWYEKLFVFTFFNFIIEFYVQASRNALLFQLESFFEWLTDSFFYAFVFFFQFLIILLFTHSLFHFFSFFMIFLFLPTFHCCFLLLIHPSYFISFIRFFYLSFVYFFFQIRIIPFLVDYIVFHSS